MNYKFAAFFLAGITCSSFGIANESQSMDPRFAPAPTEAACRSLTLASTGGPLVKDPKILAVRWLGYTTFELVYGGEIILLDNYYDRGPRYRYLGFKAADVKRANLIIVGHGHHDHMSDTAQTIQQTGAPVIAAPITVKRLLEEGVDSQKIMQVTGTDNQILKFKGFTVQPVLARHGEPTANPSPAKFSKVYAEAEPGTPEQRAIEAAIKEKGSQDPHILNEGTIAYIITFDDGFRLAYRDSGGLMTDYEKAAMAKIGRVDVLIGAIAAETIAESNAAILMPMIETYRPAVYFPAHHEERVGADLDRATEPLFQYIKNAFPDTVTVSKEFREPTCFDTRRNLKSGNAL
ncbi:MAG: beta-lactamase [Herbaspirillum sp.]|nr:beta-lactamase [Herbaspirillum sp.]